MVAGYGVAYAVLLVLGGRLGDMVGRRRLFLWGLAAFGLTSLACGLAPDAWTLVGARVAQGAAAALLLPQVLATIQATTTGQRRAKAVSLYGGTAGVSSVVGQVLGGVLVSVDLAGTGWRAIFLVNVPVARAAWCWPPVGPRDPLGAPGPGGRARHRTARRRPDHPAAAADRGPGGGLAAVVLGPAGAFPLRRRRVRAVGAPGRAPRPYAAGPALAAAHPFRAQRTRMLVPFSLGFGGFMFVVAVALQSGLHFGPFAAGLSLAPMCAAFFLASLAGPRLVLRFGRRVVTGRFSDPGPGLALLALTVHAGWPDMGGGPRAGHGRCWARTGDGDAGAVPHRAQRTAGGAGGRGQRGDGHHPAVRPRPGRGHARHAVPVAVPSVGIATPCSPRCWRSSRSSRARHCSPCACHAPCADVP